MEHVLPYYEKIPLSNVKKNQLCIVLVQFEKTHRDIFKNIQLQSSKYKNQHWGIYEEMNVNSFGRALSCIELFKLLDINEEETLLLHKLVQEIFNRTDMSLYIEKNPIKSYRILKQFINGITYILNCINTMVF